MPRKKPNELGKTAYKKLRDIGLRPKQINFIKQYVETMNATQSYIDNIAREGTTYDSAGTESRLTLQRPLVRKGVQFLFDTFIAEKKLKLETKLLDSYYRRAFYDITMFQDEEGNFKKLTGIDKEWRCCVDATEVKYYGKDAQRRVVVSKLPDRDKALDKLSKYIEMIKEKLDLHVSTISEEARTNLQDILAKSREETEKK